MFRGFSDPYTCEIEEEPGYAWRVTLKKEPYRDLASGSSLSMQESVLAACVAMAKLKKQSRSDQSADPGLTEGITRLSEARSRAERF